MCGFEKFKKKLPSKEMFIFLKQVKNLTDILQEISKEFVLMFYCQQMFLKNLEIIAQRIMDYVKITI